MQSPFFKAPEAPMIQVHRIWTEYKQDPTDAAKLVPVDMVAYGAVGQKDRSMTIEKISRLSKLLPKEQAQENPAILMAHYRWDIISRHYEAYKAGRAPTIDGTPLSAWNAISPEQAEVLILRGIATVEQIASLSETHLTHLGVPGLSALIPQAKRFVDSLGSTKVAAELAQKDEQIAAMQEQMAELVKMVGELTRAQNAGTTAAGAPTTADEDNDDDDDTGVTPIAPPRQRRR